MGNKWFVVVAACAIVLVSRTAGASEKKQTIGWETSLGMGSFAMGLGDKSFSASGRYPTGGTGVVQGKGADVGLMAPSFIAPEMGFRVLGRYWSVGMLGAISFTSGPDGRPASPQIASQVNANSTFAWLAAAEGTLSIPLDPVTIRIGVVGGARGASFPVTAFEPIPCGKHNRSRCAVRADVSEPFIQPRVGLDVALMHDSKSSLTLGGYVGFDPMTSTANGGLVLSFRTPQWLLGS